MMGQIMTEEEKISVIVPIYMGAPWLRRCVASIQNQSYTNTEIILVDDGSPDESGEICDELQKTDSRIKVVHKENGGLSDARNAGIAVAEGEYIMYVDEDDYIHPDTLKIMHEVIGSTGADIAVFDFEMIPDKLVESFPVIEKVKEPVCYEGQDIMNQLWYKNLRTVVAWDKIYRKSVYDHTRYIKGRIHDDESAIHYILGQCKKTAYVDEKLYYYVQREGSITAKRKWTYYADTFQAYEERLAYLTERGYTEAAVFTRIQMLHFITVNYPYMKEAPEAADTIKRMQETVKAFLTDTEVTEKLTDEQKSTYRAFAENPAGYEKKVKRLKKREQVKEAVKNVLRPVKRLIKR
jgi:glycosyltransferase involved in cell wall biosynthesis